MNRIFLFVLLTITASIWGQTPGGQAGQSSLLFLRADLGPRPSALSGAYTAVADDEHALFYNPAGLANIKYGAVGLNHVQWFEDIRMDNLTVAYNFHQRLGMAVSVSHLWMSSIQGKDIYGQNTEKLDVSSSIVHLGLGYRFHAAAYGGIGVKYFNENLAGYRVNGLALDAGYYMQTLLRGLTFGLAIQNIGGKVRYDQTNEQLPLTYRAGLAYRFAAGKIRIAADVAKSVDSRWLVPIGVEYRFIEYFALRLGNIFQSQSLLDPSFGAGFQFDGRYAIDYATFIHSELGMTHKIGITFNFNRTSSPLTKKGGQEKGIPGTLKPPDHVTGAIDGNTFIIKWTPVPGAQYNVYARTSKDDPWVKINSAPLYYHQLAYKKPQHVKTIYIAVSCIAEQTESAFSKEAVIHVE
jgi:hypothetical protein